MPALLEPGEFVMSRAMVDNARRGSSSAGNVNLSVTVNHYGDVRGEDDMERMSEEIKNSIISEFRLVPSFG